MGNNSININTTNDHLLLKTIKYKKTTYIALEFNVLACDRHTTCDGVKPANETLHYCCQ